MAGRVRQSAGLALGSGESLMRADVHVLGAADLARAFAQLGSDAEIRKAAEAALRPAATLIAQAQKARAPTAQIRRAIKVSKRANVGRASAQRAYIKALRATVNGVVFIGIDGKVNRGEAAEEVYAADVPRRLAKNRGKSRRGRPGRLVNSVSIRAGVEEFGNAYQPAKSFMRGGYQTSKAPGLALIRTSLWPAIAKTAQQAARRRARRAARGL